MGKKLTSFYLLFSILFFLILVVVFTIRVQDIRKANIGRISGDFDTIRKTVEATYRQQESFDSFGFKNIAKALFDSDPNLNVLVVYSYETGIEYLRARNADFLSSRATDIAAIKGVPQFTYNSFSQTKITSSITIPRKNSFILEGVYQVVTERQLFPVLRDTVLLLVAFALVTLGLFFFFRFFCRTEPASGRTAREARPEPAAERREAAEPEKPLPAEPPREPEPKKAEPAPRQEAAPAQAEPQPKPAEKVEKPMTAEIPKPAAQEAKAPVESEAKHGLFSPESGLGWQEYLEKRLTLELERAAFNEQDLSLVLMKYRELAKDSPFYRTIAKEILDKIAFEDLAFEYDNGFAVILPNSTLDQTIRTMMDFHRKVDESVTRTFGKPQCGVTSRNGRLVDGYRLIIEAEQALDRTSPRDEDCIVGFRTDPGKYRKYLSGKGAQGHPA